MKTYKAVQKLLVGDTQTDRLFDKPTFIFGKYARKIMGSARNENL
jgi:hypothetical protein